MREVGAVGGDLVELINDDERDLVLEQKQVVDDRHVRPQTVRRRPPLLVVAHLVGVAPWQRFHGDEQERGVMQQHEIEPEVELDVVVDVVSSSSQVVDPVQVVHQCLLPKRKDHLLQEVQHRHVFDAEGANVLHAQRFLPLLMLEVVMAGVVGTEGYHHRHVRERVDVADTAMHLADRAVRWVR